MGRKSELSSRERRDLVLMMLRKEEPITVPARRYGVSQTTRHRWREEFLAGGDPAEDLPQAIAAGRARPAGPC